MPQRPPSRVGIAHCRERHLAPDEMRIRVSPHERALIVRQQTKGWSRAKKRAIALGCEAIAGKSFPSVVGFSPENHGLSSQCELQTGCPVHGHTSIDELEKVSGADIFLGGNDANVVG